MNPQTESVIAELGRAIREGDWPVARRQWDWLLRHHPDLAVSHPHVTAILRDEDAMTYPRSASIH